MAASATFALKAGVWFRRGRLVIVSPDSLGTACPLSGRNSTYRPVQISGAGSHMDRFFPSPNGHNDKTNQACAALQALINVIAVVLCEVDCADSWPLTLQAV